MMELVIENETQARERKEDERMAYVSRDPKGEEGIGNESAEKYHSCPRGQGDDREKEGLQ